MIRSSSTASGSSRPKSTPRWSPTPASTSPTPSWSRTGSCPTYTPPPAHSIDTATILAHTRTQLPPHLQPRHLVELLDIPLTPNGKLDRTQLPTPDLADQTPYRAPSNPVEQLLVDAVAAALGRERVGIDDSFFGLGGDSIMAIQLVSAARAAGLVFTPRDVFESKTIAALAAVADVASSGRCSRSYPAAASASHR